MLVVLSHGAAEAEALQGKAFEGFQRTLMSAGNNAIRASQPLNIVQVITRKNPGLYLLKSAAV